MIVFSNPTELDPRLVTTFGVNVKLGADPIGHFGTGLKYAIAVLLRTDHKVQIKSGPATLTFDVDRQEIRGKPFDIVTMHDGRSPVQSLSFTTDLGKNWQVWMAYRELYSNALDEGGGVTIGPTSAKTQIKVSGPGIEDVHARRSEYFLEGEPILRTATCDVHPGLSNVIFHRGIRVLCLGQPSLYTYDIRCPLALTEDRQAQSTWELYSKISSTIIACSDREMISKILRAGPGHLESNLDFDWPSFAPGETFIRCVADLRQTGATFNSTALAKVKVGRQLKPRTISVSMEEMELTTDICNKIELLGINTTFPIHFSTDISLPVEIIDDEIWLQPGQGEQGLTITLCRELLELAEGSSSAALTWALRKLLAQP